MVDVGHPLVQVVDWVVVLALVVGALVARRHRRSAAALLVATAGTWAAASWFVAALFWHRALLVHQLLAHPGLRPRTRVAMVVVASTYVICVITPVVLSNEAATWASAVVIPAAAAWNLRHSHGLSRYHRRAALSACLLLAVALGLGSLLRLKGGSGHIGTAVLLYDVAVVLAVAVVVNSLRPPEASQVTDLVVDVGRSSSISLRDALAAALHDPGLRLGSWDSSVGAHVDHGGRRLPTVAPPGRTLLPLERDGRAHAMLMLDAEQAADPRIVTSIEAAIRVAEVNSRRQGELVALLQQLQASRRRLVTVADDERARLERDLESDVVSHLVDLSRALERLPETRHVMRAREHVTRTLHDLHVVSRGLRPDELDRGLLAALEGLAAASGVVAEVHGPDGDGGGDLPPHVELTAWYLCSEALTNTAKHAPTARVHIALSRDARTLRVVVSDDGPGGAVPVAGGGLVGLRDRVEGLGGTLSVRSTSDGTQLSATLPLT